MKHNLDDLHQEKLTEKEECLSCGAYWDKIDKLVKDKREEKNESGGRIRDGR